MHKLLLSKNIHKHHMLVHGIGDMNIKFEARHVIHRKQNFMLNQEIYVNKSDLVIYEELLSSVETSKTVSKMG